MLTDFLGSGKTTFLGRVLANPEVADTLYRLDDRCRDSGRPAV